jgi:hypothetical protein
MRFKNKKVNAPQYAIRIDKSKAINNLRCRDACSDETHRSARSASKKRDASVRAPLAESKRKSGKAEQTANPNALGALGSLYPLSLTAIQKSANQPRASLDSGQRGTAGAKARCVLRLLFTRRTRRARTLGPRYNLNLSTCHALIFFFSFLARFVTRRNL